MTRTSVLAVRTLGDGGPQVSVLGLGCNNFGWRLDGAESRAVIEAALDAGITLVDTADTYGETASESALGASLGDRRADVVLITKFGLPVPDAPSAPPGSADYIRWAIDGSRRRLATDYVDVYMYHRYDKITPWPQTLDALARLHDAGAIRYAGVSGLGAGDLERVHALCAERGLPLVAAENRCSLIYRRFADDVLPACRRLGIGFLPFYPLEGGLLTGRYRRGAALDPDSRFARNPQIWPVERWLTDERFDRVENLERIAARHGVTLLQLAIGGLIHTGGVTSVIAGARTPEQVRANVEAARWTPTPSQLRELGGGHE